VHYFYRTLSTALLVTFLLSGCDDTDTSPGEAPSAPPSGQSAGDSRPQPTERARVESRSRSIQVAGRLRPRTRITHEVPVAGVIRRVVVEPGDRVTEGNLLFTVERDEVGQTFRPVAVPARLDGIVSEVYVQEEEQVRQGTGGALVVGDDGYVLEAEISDKDANLVSVGQQVSGQTREGAQVTGTLTRRSQEPDYETGLFSLTFRFLPETPGGIGAFVILELPTERLTGFFVPRDAVDRRYGRYYLWTIDEREVVLRRQEVALGESIGDAVEITSGLEAGERYLTRLTGREREGASAPPEREAAGRDRPSSNRD
jgi:multidrug efflux pump subunit AcrA (membrane-fusion protein)